MRIERLIYSVLIILLAVIACIQWRRAALFRADNEELRGRIELLEVEVETGAYMAKRAQNKLDQLRAQTAEKQNESPAAVSPAIKTAAQP